MHFSILQTIIVVLLAALIITVIFRRLHLPDVLGYFIVGAIMGPHALGVIPDLAYIKALAEFGIVFLMFAVGLEFSVAQLLALKKSVFVVGCLQVLCSTIITTLFGMYFGMAMLPALVVGGIAAMSSTAVVIKQLHAQNELHTRHGLNAVGILLFQDIAVIPFIILIVSLSKNTTQTLPFVFLWAFTKGLFAIILIYIVGRWLLKPLFHLIAKTKATELFTVTVLLITLTAAWLTNSLGLSFPLGAFLAAIMVAETEFRHQIEVEIRPFRDILLGLFFITMGMLANITLWPALWVWISLLLVALIIGKIFLITVISRFVRYSYADSLRSGIVLAQGGEFGFAILTLALSHNMLSPEYGQVILAALLISIALAPILINFNKHIAKHLQFTEPVIADQLQQETVFESAKKLSDHIIICGYGRVGQHISHILNEVSYSHICIDQNSELIKKASLVGDLVIYGDASHPGILKAAGIDKAIALAITFNELKSTLKTLSLIKRSHPTLPIFVRCKDKAELTQLKKHRPTKIIAEIFEESITLSRHLLRLIKIPADESFELLKAVRSKNYNFLRHVFPSTTTEGKQKEILEQEIVVPILLGPHAYCIDHQLKDFNFKAIGIEIIAIRRPNSKLIKPNPNTKLCANDIIVVYGNETNVEMTETLLIYGK
jgi:CPA2 family monovalent cation:H+ antiporter-2